MRMLILLTSKTQEGGAEMKVAWGGRGPFPPVINTFAERKNFPPPTSAPFRRLLINTFWIVNFEMC